MLDPLDEDALVRVLTEPKNSLVRQYKELLHLDNAELVFTDAALHAIGPQDGGAARAVRAVCAAWSKICLSLSCTTSPLMPPSPR